MYSFARHFMKLRLSLLEDKTVMYIYRKKEEQDLYLLSLVLRIVFQKKILNTVYTDTCDYTLLLYYNFTCYGTSVLAVVQITIHIYIYILHLRTRTRAE